MQSMLKLWPGQSGRQVYGTFIASKLNRIRCPLSSKRDRFLVAVILNRIVSLISESKRALFANLFALVLRTANDCEHFLSVNTKQNRLCYPVPSSGLVTLAVVGAIIVNGAGFGLRWLELCGAWTCFAAVVLLGIGYRSPFAIAMGILGYAASFFAPAVLHLHSFWFAVFGSLPCLFFLAMATLCQWLLTSIPCGLPAFGGLGFAIFTLLFFRMRLVEIPRRTALALVLLVVGSDIFNLRMVRGPADFEPYPNVEYQYRVGDTAAKLLGKNGMGTSRLLRSSIHGTSKPDQTPGILLLDHDQWKTRPEIAGTSNFTQPVPWQFNSFLGDQYVLFWLRCDGFLASNLGGTIRTGGRVLLQTAEPGNPQILMAQRGSVVILGDSDPVVNRIAPYQKHLLSYFLSGNAAGYLPLIFGAFVCLAIAVGGSKGKFFAGAIVLLGVVLTGTICTKDRTYGGVRMVGITADPHDPSAFSGVLRGIVDGGQDDLFAPQSPRVLYVQEGHSAHVRTEQLVIAEPGAQVFVGRDRFDILDLPLGPVRNIPDARAIRAQKSTVEGVLTTGSVTILATGSPAQISPKEWLSH